MAALATYGAAASESEVSNLLPTSHSGLCSAVKIEHTVAEVMSMAMSPDSLLSAAQVLLRFEEDDKAVAAELRRWFVVTEIDARAAVAAARTLARGRRDCTRPTPWNAEQRS